jgi:hypothetical protein
MLDLEKMNPIFNNAGFLQNFKSKRFFYLGNITKEKVRSGDSINYITRPLDYNLFDHIKLIKTHNEKNTSFYDKNQTIELRSLEFRGKTPEFAKSLIKDLKELYIEYTGNPMVTLISFSGYGLNSKSFGIHKDTMDVFYLQVYGEIIWSVWESQLEDLNLNEDQANCIYKKKFIPGDMIYIPAGTYHHVEHLDEPRVGFSFGNA